MDARNSIPEVQYIPPNNEEPIKKTTGSTSGSIMQRLGEALQQRWKSIVHVIDEALQSESLKDRIWAVEQLLKRLKPDTDAAPTQTHANAPPPLTPKQLQSLSDDDLMAAIEGYLTPAQHSTQHEKHS
jgi:hypothetical protein